MAINGVAVLLLGLLPGPLMALCVAAIRSAWHLLYSDYPPNIDKQH